MQKFHSLKSLPARERRRSALSLRKAMKQGSGASVCQKEELNMPVSAIRLQFVNLLRLLLTGKGA